MAITADVVKKLRDLTGAGMMDCKKALVKADGDFDAAERLLKEMGLAAIANRQEHGGFKHRKSDACGLNAKRERNGKVPEANGHAVFESA